MRIHESMNGNFKSSIVPMRVFRVCVYISALNWKYREKSLIKKQQLYIYAIRRKTTIKTTDSDAVVMIVFYFDVNFGCFVVIIIYYCH